MPSGPVKVYLNELIYNAEQIRAQLFGLLGQNSPPQMANWGTATTSADPNLSGRLGELESQLKIQTQAVEQITDAKTQLEKELAEAKRLNEKNAAPDPAKEAQTKKLNDRVANLEARLAEYSIIEDDLANLKRFQQENAELKAKLGLNQPEKTDAPTSEAESETEGQDPQLTDEPKTDAPITDEPMGEISEPKEPEAQAKPSAISEQKPAQAASPSATPKAQGKPTAKASQSSQNHESPQVPEPVTISSATKSTPDSAEEDLVAEFEKMLKS